MADSNTVDVDPKTTAEAAQASDSDDEDGNEILEESPCGRWQKRREKVKQRDVPGIDAAYLAMDTELGVEVVWNEVQFSERKNFRAQEETLKAVFDNLTQLQHPNLVKFHKYWMDTKSEKPRVIFITEYMSSGSMSQFLKRTKKGNKAMSEKAWRKWCTQILAALNYLHSLDPSIVHANLTCNTIFIQHNGLIKIGCVAPDAIHHHVKTFRENVKNMHYISPEYESNSPVTTAADIFAFGVCALEMALLGFSTNCDSANVVITPELIEKNIQLLEEPLQRDFIERCLAKDPHDRPTARELLFHPVLFEVHSLKLLAAHAIVNDTTFNSLNEDVIRIKEEDKDRVIAEIIHRNGKPPIVFKYSELSLFELDKFLEDVRNCVYPLTAYSHPSDRQPRHPTHGLTSPRVLSPPQEGLHQTASVPEDDSIDEHVETRRIVSLAAEVKPCESGNGCNLTMLFKMDDKTNRQLGADIADNDTPELLANELVYHGFIHQEDRLEVMNAIATALIRFQLEQTPALLPAPRLRKSLCVCTMKGVCAHLLNECKVRASLLRLPGLMKMDAEIISVIDELLTTVCNWCDADDIWKEESPSSPPTDIVSKDLEFFCDLLDVTPTQYTLSQSCLTAMPFMEESLHYDRNPISLKFFEKLDNEELSKSQCSSNESRQKRVYDNDGFLVPSPRKKPSNNCLTRDNTLASPAAVCRRLNFEGQSCLESDMKKKSPVSSSNQLAVVATASSNMEENEIVSPKKVTWKPEFRKDGHKTPPISRINRRILNENTNKDENFDTPKFLSPHANSFHKSKLLLMQCVTVSNESANMEKAQHDQRKFSSPEKTLTEEFAPVEEILVNLQQQHSNDCTEQQIKPVCPKKIMLPTKSVAMKPIDFRSFPDCCPPLSVGSYQTAPLSFRSIRQMRIGLSRSRCYPISEE